MKQITSPGWVHKTSVQGWCTWKNPEGWDGEGGRREDINKIKYKYKYKSMADSCQCMAKTTTIL